MTATCGRDMCDPARHGWQFNHRGNAAAEPIYHRECVAAPDRRQATAFLLLCNPH